MHLTFQGFLKNTFVSITVYSYVNDLSTRFKHFWDILFFFLCFDICPRNQHKCTVWSDYSDF